MGAFSVDRELTPGWETRQHPHPGPGWSPEGPGAGTAGRILFPREASEGFARRAQLLPRLDSLVENGEVKVPAQAADDPVVGHTHGKVVTVVLGEGDGLGSLVTFLQVEL